MYSKDYRKDNVGRPIQFEVAENVVVDGATVFRRGALAVGHLTDFKNAGGYGRQATLEFTSIRPPQWTASRFRLLMKSSKSKAAEHLTNSNRRPKHDRH
jgi:hypothetical protein